MAQQVSLQRMVYDSAERYPHQLAVADPSRKLTYAQFTQEINALAHGLQELTLAPQARILILLTNSVEFLCAHFAILAAGGISVPCDPNINAEHLNLILMNAAPDFIVLSDTALAQHRDVFSKIAKNRLIVVTNTQKNTEIISYSELIQAHCNRHFNPHLTRKNEIAAVMYTTGSTGIPKGVTLTHQNVLTTLHNISRFIGYTAQDREVVILPLFHSFGLGHAYCNFLNGGFIYTEPGLARIKRVLAAIQEYQATGFPGTPMGYGILLDRYATLFQEQAQSLRFVVINSAPLPVERAQQIIHLFPHINLMVYYGLTEASRSTFISLTQQTDMKRFSSVGKPFPNVDLNILTSTGEPTKVGEVGNIIIRGPTVAQGYWRAEKNDPSFQNNELHTGDLGYFDEEGYLYLVGRTKEMINVGGLKVVPIEVEKVLSQYPGIKEVAVTAILLNKEELVGAAVVLKDEKISFDEEECARFCAKYLEKYKIPHTFTILPSIPRNETGKIKRFELQKILQEKCLC